MFKGYLCLKSPSIQEVHVLAVAVIGTSIYGMLLIDGVLMLPRVQYMGSRGRRLGLRSV